ncbi:MAG: hypothetical protein J0L92_19855 [Deltaproteobacteria bacterium]|nr:hypothetical protein [Deltaproteobacteria bacterium]
MKRRSLLVYGGIAGALATTGIPLLDAFAQERVPSDGLLAGLSEAYRAAQRAGRPLLVLVIPEDNGARWERGSALGAFLNHGTDDAMTAVGSCELTCAPMTVLRQLVPQAPPGEPLLVLVDPARVPASVSAIDPALPPEPPYAVDGEDWEAQRTREDAYVDAQIAAISNAVVAALATRIAASTPAQRTAARARAIDTYRAHRVRGSYWAFSGGCGVSVEDAPPQLESMVACGMGHTPERARRFLYFFAPSGH